MKIFKTQLFSRFLRKKRIHDSLLCEAVIRAERGLIDADLGGGLIKQRIPRPNEGRSGGYRAMLAYQSETLTVFIYGFAKNEQGNVSEGELVELRESAQVFLNFDEEQISEMLARDYWKEVICND